MKIIQLTIDNFKRLKALEITPEGNTIILEGKNGAGKTSVLDAIWAVLSNPGAKEFPKPIREGEDKATIIIKLDEKNITVKRVFTKKGTHLEVITEDGASFKSPQALLDNLLGKLTFDPLEFKEMNEKTQTQLLLGLVDIGIDLDALAEQRQDLFAERTVINRTVQEAKAQLPFEPPPEVTRVSVLDVARELEKARSHNRWLDSLVQDKNRVTVAIEGNLGEIQLLKEVNKGLEKEKTKIYEQLNSQERADETHLELRLSHSETINHEADAYDRYVEAKANYKSRQEESESHTDKIAAIDKQKADAIKNVKFPIAGLGFDEMGVTFNEIPLKQISDAEQLRVSLAIAMAMNPELRVIRIRNGSLLDSDNLAIIEQMADDKDFQIWIERVSDGEGVGIIIEDGTIKE